METTQKNRGNAGKGRRKGSKNKRPRVVQEQVLQALNYAGGVEYLKRQAEENPRAFLALLGKLIPRRIEGDDEKPQRVITTIKHVIVNPRDNPPGANRPETDDTLKPGQ